MTALCARCGHDHGGGACPLWRNLGLTAADGRMESQQSDSPEPILAGRLDGESNRDRSLG